MPAVARRLRRQQNHRSSTQTTRPATAPRIPPIMAPVFVDLVPPLLGPLVGVVVAETEDMLVGLLRLTPDVTADVLEPEDLELDVDLDVVWEDVVDLSSGHTPVVHGSLEQHPRKLPTSQTYHCLFPVHALEPRGARDSIVKGIAVKTSVGLNGSGE